MNGKGDAPRNCFSQRFRDNYDAINWTMPISPPSPCRHPGCPTLVHDGSGYCATHQSDRRAASHSYDQTRRLGDPNLAQAMRIRRGTEWRKVSELMRAQHPLCCDPFKAHDGVPVPATQVHHVFPIGRRPDLAFSEEHLRCVCTRCHALLERADARGEETFKLFGFEGEPPTDAGPGFVS